MSPTLSSEYDLIPYNTQAQRLNYLERLTVIARLQGVQAKECAESRVLEIGCGNGNNLIPMAYAYPRATFIGIDKAEKPINEGEEKISKLKLKNIALRSLDILQIEKNLGFFDYIICHGIFSWVPEDVRNKILFLYANHLSPTGVGYISYNTYPGWHIRGMARDILKFGSRTASTLEDSKKPLAALEALLKTHPNYPIPDLLPEIQTALHQPDWYIKHDYLSDTNQPFYFFEFSDLITQQGLQYLGDAEVPKMFPQEMPADSRKLLVKITNNAIDKNQYMDFYRNTMFRRSLICHQDHQLNTQPENWSIKDFLISSQLTCKADPSEITNSNPLRFSHHNGGAIGIADSALKIAFQELSAIWPQTLKLEELLKITQNKITSLGLSLNTDSAKLETVLIRAYLGDLIHLQVCEGAYNSKVEKKPRLSKLARYEATQGAQVTTFQHEVVTLSENEKILASLLDGSRTVQDLCVDWANNHQDAKKVIEAILESFKNNCLLEKS